MRLTQTIVAILLLCALVTAPACAGHRAPILVAQAGLAASKSVGELSELGRKLRESSIIPPTADLNMQQTLLRVNDKLKELPDVLRTIDRLQQAGDPTKTETDRAIAILEVIGQDISIVIGGVPISDVTKPLIELVKATQKTVQTVLVEVAKIQGREQ